MGWSTRSFYSGPQLLGGDRPLAICRARALAHYLDVGARSVYSDVERLQAQLEAAARPDWSDRLTSAMRGGATSGEILVRLGDVLDELRHQDWVTVELRSDTARLFEEVERLLYPPSWVWNPQLSRYEPPGEAQALEFTYSLTGQGLAEAYVSDGRNWLRPTASYLSDALRALTDAVDKIVRRHDRIACIWEGEPGSFIWIFEARGEAVTVEIYRNFHSVDARWQSSGVRGGDNFSVAFEPPAGRVPGEIQARFSTTRRDLGTAVLAALDRLLDDEGDSGYANRWGAHPFPHPEHNRLREALAMGEPLGPDATTGRMQSVGLVSTEGGPLLIVDFNAASGWSGVEGDDYERIVELLVAREEPAGLEIEIAGEPALIWQMPTGTADVWRRPDGSIVLCRPWLDPGSNNREVLAGLPPNNPIEVGRVRIKSGWVAIVWATEAGSDVAQVTPRDGLALDLSVGNAGVIAGLPRGEYDCYHDSVETGSESALRCFIVETGTRPT
jgi:hypothetical protein